MFDLTLGLNHHFSKKTTNQKNHMFFMPHAFSQSGYPLGQSRHLGQVEPFEKL
jgi:hypothetical protein